jgi:hypothetical protein
MDAEDLLHKVKVYGLSDNTRMEIADIVRTVLLAERGRVTTSRPAP